MALNYAWEKFHIAMGSLATDTRSLQERLAAAYAFNIMMLDEKDVTPEILERLEKLGQKLTSKGAVGDEGTIEATTSQMTDMEARELILEIVSLHDDVCEEYYKAQ